MHYLIIFICSAAWAVEPDEVLTNVEYETRARAISKNLRCLVCRNENIDSSNAGIAKDLRILVRDRIKEGDSNEEVIGFHHRSLWRICSIKSKNVISKLIIMDIWPIIFTYWWVYKLEIRKA